MDESSSASANPARTLRVGMSTVTSASRAGRCSGPTGQPSSRTRAMARARSPASRRRTSSILTPLSASAPTVTTRHASGHPDRFPSGSAISGS